MSNIYNDKVVEVDYESFCNFVINENEDTQTNSDEFHPIIAFFNDETDTGNENKDNYVEKEKIISFPIALYINDE